MFSSTFPPPGPKQPLPALSLTQNTPLPIFRPSPPLSHPRASFTCPGDCQVGYGTCGMMQPSHMHCLLRVLKTASFIHLKNLFIWRTGIYCTVGHPALVDHMNKLSSPTQLGRKLCSLLSSVRQVVLNEKAKHHQVFSWLQGKSAWGNK